MSCLRLRLPPARKAWKSFTSKLHSKLHKRKAINKSRNRVKPSTTISIRVRPYKFLQLRLQRKPRFSLRFSQNCRSLLQNRHAHVYVDKLFKEPAVSELVAERCQQQKTPPAKCVIKTIEDRSVPEASKQSQSAVGENSESEGVTSAADDMWESLGFASPQMDGIDERAEEFIARFRAEMKDQETLARRHL
ncbi:hypothetical protein RchiOBHm_Chr6g0288121 [Rosa chinensis]|uniref:DUF761 domain-containing protein n=1 Tax=Rosa chinensis TaxID=74649 RepID=A0A2P6PVA3_ROSCH|nr:uncharacterized protein LOC112169374 [Rosa chinensis]PRQ25851.1 hypothetical protein RchiOBHm_Chr6g0288121 [Rosa chinensis]